MFERQNGCQESCARKSTSSKHITFPQNDSPKRNRNQLLDRSNLAETPNPSAETSSSPRVSPEAHASQRSSLGAFPAAQLWHSKSSDQQRSSERPYLSAFLPTQTLLDPHMPYIWRGPDPQIPRFGGIKGCLERLGTWFLTSSSIFFEEPPTHPTLGVSVWCFGILGQTHAPLAVDPLERRQKMSSTS